MGNKGRFASNILEKKRSLELLKTPKTGYAHQVVISMDVAASEYYRFFKYDLDFKYPDDSRRLTCRSPSSRSIQ